MKPKWDTMSNSEKVALGTTLAGVNQYKVFSAIMSNFDKAVDSVNEQLTITGTTMKQNEVYMQSMQAKLALLRAEFEKFALSGNVLQNLAKVVLDLATNGLKLLNTNFGQTVVKLTILTTAIKLGQQTFVNYKNKILESVASMWKLEVEELKLSFATYTLGEKFEFLTLTMMKNPLFWGALAITTIAGINTMIKKFNTTLEEEQDKLDESKKGYEETTSSIEKLEGSLSNIQKKINQINKQSKLSITDKSELNDLRLEREELELQLKLLKEKQAIQQKEYADQAKETVSKEVYNPLEVKSTPFGGVNIEKANRVDILKQASNEMISYGNVIDSLSAKKEKLGYLTEKEEKTLDDAVQRYQLASSTASTYASDLREETSSLQDNDETKKRVNEAVQLYNKALEERSVITEEAIGYAQFLAETDEDLDGIETSLSKNSEELIKELERLMKVYDFSTTSIDNMKNAFETLATVQDELNSKQGLTVETYDALMSMGSEYINILFDETGALRDTAEAQKDLYRIKIQQMALDEVNQLIETVRTMKEAGATTEDYNKVLGEKVSLEWENAYAQVLGMDIDEEQKEALIKRIKQMQTWADKASKNIDIMTSSTKATKENNKVLKDQKSAYEEAIRYIKSKYDEEINALKDEKKASIDAIEEQIKARKEQKEQEIQAIEDEVDALKEEKEARQDYWDAQIDALKKANEERKDSLELQEKLDALAKAKTKKVKVYKEGQGFVYDEDESAVSKAQSDLSKYLSEQEYEKELERLTKLKEEELNSYDTRLNALSDFKKQKQKEYDDEIDILEKYKDSVEKNYDAQIEIYEDYKKQFEDMVDAYEDNQSKLLVQQLTGIDLENKNWMTRLDNLQNFVNQYHSLLAQVDGDSGSGGGGGSNSNRDSGKDKNTTTDSKNKLSEADIDSVGTVLTKAKLKAKDIASTLKPEHFKYQVLDEKGNRITSFDDEESANQYVRDAYRNKKLNYSVNKVSLGRYATGASRIKDDQIALVGDSPNSELVIGSKLNNDVGVVMGLSQGSGVVNAKSTATLAGLFNSLSGSMSNATEREITNNSGQSISIGSISLPEVKNGQDFVDYLQNFSLDMKQATFARI